MKVFTDIPEISENQLILAIGAIKIDDKYTSMVYFDEDSEVPPKEKLQQLLVIQATLTEAEHALDNEITKALKAIQNGTK